MTLVKWAYAVTGTREGSRLQSKWAAESGISSATAWCAAFVAAGLRRLGISPPSSPASVDSWFSWSGGESVGTDLKEAHPGDLLGFDWGDGGIRDHIAIYIGHGKMISGNDSNNSVGVSSVPVGNLVGIIRPKALGSGSGGGGGGILSGAKGRLDEAFELSTTGVAGALAGLGGEAGDAVSGVFPDAAEIAGDVIKQLADLLGVNGPAILLNVAFVGGGAFLIYYGLAKSAGVSEPAQKLAKGVAVAAAAAPK